MNKKLLFATMSLAALAACTNDDFESKSIAEGTSPVQFEVINIDDAKTRASMNDDNSIKWSAKDGDLFTLYHGASSPYTTGYENATYTANANDGATATLTTPTMIKQGGAVMVWPVDTTFRIKPADALTIKIPAEQTNIVNNIPYMSDLIDVQAYAAYSETAPAAKPTAYTTAGKGRKYAVYMRPMASQLIVKADYAGSDATLAQLYEGGSAQPADGGIAEISVTSIDLLTKDATTTPFTTEIPVTFTSPGSGTGSIKAQWDAAVPLNVWSQITDFDIANIAPAGQTDKLSAKEDCLNGTDGCTVLILPQATISGGVSDGGVLVNTLYGRVIVAAPGKTYATQYPTSTTVPTSQYTAAEYADAWYRYVSATTAAATGETKATTATPGLGYKTTANIEMGMQQTINGFSTYTKQSGVVKGEPVGAAATRYVKVLLSHLDMSDLHIKTDKHLRDAALVWKHLNLPDVTVLLDGKGAAGEFEISQKTIKVINDINASVTGKSFKVMPCQVTGEVCNTIVITGANDIQNVQDMAFITPNGGVKADVALKAGETWKWGVDNKVVVPAAGVNSIINRGTFVSDATANIKTQEAPRATGAQNNVPFVNDGTWNVKAPATLNVQFNVTNNGTVNIEKGAQYRQDGQVQNTLFTNEAATLPQRFLTGTATEKIGKVINNGVFATVAASGKTAEIYNYGLIEHADVNAKTYITKNETTGANFANAFNATIGSENKMGRINLPFSNKDEDNISISAAANQGFVSVTVTSSDAPASKALDASVVGTFVNYIIVNSGIEKISNISTQVKYVEIASTEGEIAWSLDPLTPTATYDGLMVLSDVNIKLGTTITVNKATYLGADMYVGGTFTNTGGFIGYYGDTSANEATKYITY